LTSAIKTYIQLAEAKFNRKLRTREMLTRSTASTTNEFLPVPPDFLETYSLMMDAPNPSYFPPLQYVNEDTARLMKGNYTSGSVRFYSIIGSQFELIPRDGTDQINLTLTYYSAIPALSDSEPVNWLILKSPDIYLYSAMLEAAPYLKNDERIPIWAAAQQQLLEDMKIESDRSMRPATTLIARKRTF
jgi:hypothetical protein